MNCDEQERQWEQEKKLHAARWAWRNRRRYTRRKVTWERWFEQKFGEPLQVFAQRMMEKKNDERVPEGDQSPKALQSKPR
tara:strand:+ start:785 stop:1024 length:240 start_codon:yes stop_codon:yes gene_type:complete